MAKQPQDPRHDKSKPQDEPELIAEEDVEAPPPSKTTKMVKPTPPPLPKKPGQPTMLGPGAPKAPNTPAKMPKMSLEDEVIETAAPDSAVVEVQPASDTVEAQLASDVVEAQVASDVVEAQAASDVVEARPASDVVEARPASDVVEVEPASDVVDVQLASDRAKAEPISAGDVIAEAAEDEEVISAEAMDEDLQAAGASAPETPVRAEQDPEALAAKIFEEDAIGDEPAVLAESSVRVRGKRPLPPEKTETFDGTEAPDDVDQTAAFEEATTPGDDSSAVDLGAMPYPKGSSSHAGVDEVAEALESGVKLESAGEVKTPPPRKSEPSVEFDDLFTGDEAKSGDSASGRTMKSKGEEPTDHDMVAARDLEDAAAADLLNDDTSPGKTIEGDSADLWKAAANEAAAADAGEASDISATPVPARKGTDEAKALDEDDEVAETEAEDEAPPPPTKKGRPPALATAPAVAAPASSGRAWMGGTLVGLALAAAGAGGAWYMGMLPDSPGAQAPAKLPVVQPPPPAPVALTVVQRARAEMDEGKYDEALQILADLQDAEKTPAALTARAEARWFKYQQEQVAKKAELNAADADVKSVLDDLDEAKNTMVKNQVLATIGYKKSEAPPVPVGSDKAVTDLRNFLAKNNVIDPKTDIKDLPKAITQALANKGQADTVLQGMQKALVSAKQIGDDDKLDLATFNKLVKDMAARQAALAEVNKALEDAKVDAGSKGVEALLNAKKDLDAKVAEVNKALADEKIKAQGAQGLKEVLALRTQLAKERDELDQALKAAYQVLADAKIVPAGGNPRKDLVSGTKAALERGESPLSAPIAQLTNALGGLALSPATDVKSGFDKAALLAELNLYRMRESLIEGPEQKLDTHLAILRSRGTAAEQSAALKDATRALAKESHATPEARAKAQAVMGLVLRQQEKYPEAKQALEAALAGPAAGVWTAPVQQALKELTDPSAFNLPRIGELQGTGQIKSAQQEIGVALKVMPGDTRLLAQRGLLKLEEARSAGKVADVQDAVRQDAAAALKNPKTAADGALVLGLLEEDLGNYAAAEKMLRQALKAHQGDREEAARIRIALARVLLQQDRAPASAPAPVAPQPKKPVPPKADAEVSQAFPLAAALLVGQAAEQEDPAADARLKESMALAKELTESKNPKVQAQGYMLLGQALAKQGKRTEGLREYLKGIDILHPGMAAKEIAKLLDDHPAFQQPEAAKAPSAYLAEVHFGKGLHLYWARQYPEAEAQFKQAAGFFGQDARYQYYLGLAQYAQRSPSKRDAASFSFERGSHLEAANRPPVTEINASLERVQGELRRVINSFRSKAIELRN